MAEITPKKITELTENTAAADTDLMMVGNAGTAALRRLKLGNLWKWIAKKIAAEVWNELSTSDKTILGAISELNSKSPKIIEEKTDFTSKTLFSYTGVSFKVPKCKFAIFMETAAFNGSLPLTIGISNSKDDFELQNKIVSEVSGYPAKCHLVVFNNTEEKTYYVWAKYASEAANKIFNRGLIIE